MFNFNWGPKHILSRLSGMGRFSVYVYHLATIPPRRDLRILKVPPKQGGPQHDDGFQCDTMKLKILKKRNKEVKSHRSSRITFLSYPKSLALLQLYNIFCPYKQTILAMVSGQLARAAMAKMATKTKKRNVK